MTLDALDMPSLLAAGFLRHAEHVESLGSTNDRARELAGGEELLLPSLVVADRQTAGRGRGANRWWTGEGSLALSVLLRPSSHDIRREHCGLLSLAAALAVMETVRPLLPGLSVGLHWPNDVFVEERKLGGVLVEALPDGRHILGIGLNVNNSLAAAPRELAGTVATLADLTGAPQSRQTVLSSLLKHMSHEIERLAAAPAEIGRRCNAACLQQGRELSLEHGQELIVGRCQGIADDGALMLETALGVRKFYGGALRKPRST